MAETRLISVALVEPTIPPNTGNIARLCAAARVPLHLVGRLGFQITDRHLRRAGLDYWEYAEIHRHETLEEFLDETPREQLHFFSKRASLSYVDASYSRGSHLVFGSETEGLPKWLFRTYEERFRRIPMFEKGVRSLNLSSAVAIVVYEALRQNGCLSD